MCTLAERKAKEKAASAIKDLYKKGKRKPKDAAPESVDDLPAYFSDEEEPTPGTSGYRSGPASAGRDLRGTVSAPSSNPATSTADTSGSATPAPSAVAPSRRPSGSGDEGDENDNMATEFDMEDKADGPKAQSDTSNLKLDFDRSDVEFWFQQLEMHLSTAAVNAQWTKRLLLHKLLPSDVVAEVKDLLRKGKAAAGTTPYKDLKDRIMETFGKKEEDAFAEAESLMLVGKPSQLLNKLINVICKNHPDLEGCCAAGQISGMWRRRLPPDVKSRIAGCSIVGKVAMKATMQTADAVFATLQSRTPTVAAVTPASGNYGAAAYNPALDASADAPALQIAAYGNSRGQPQRRGGGRGRPPQSNRPQGQGRGNPHPDGPPPTACNLHWKYGRGAFKCRKEETCPWAHYAPKKPTNTNSAT